MSTDDRHHYYTGRISFDEFLGISDNIIKISACLASPLNKLDITNPYYEKLVRKYDYLQIQPHNCEEQIEYNRHLAQLAQKYGKLLIAGTDAHSLNQYKAQCRSILMSAKHKSYGDEDSFDLTYKSYDQLCAAFQEQDAIPQKLWLQAIDRTNEMADLVEPFDLDTSLKYPIMYGSAQEDRKVFIQNCYKSLNDKIETGVIPQEQAEAFRDAIKEQIRVFDKIGMCGFMQSMSEIIRWCHIHGIKTGPARGSVGGSRVAYVTDIIDLNPEKWHTVFSRFCNEDRKEIGDIDVDVIDTDRPKIFQYIIERFGRDKTAFVPTYGTLQDKGCIEQIVRGLRFNWERDKHNKVLKSASDISPDNPYTISYSDGIKAQFVKNVDACRKKYADVFYYYDGMLNTKVSQSVHPAGIVISPVTLPDNYGVFHKDDGVVLQIDMEQIHEVSLVKYDMLVLRNIKIIRDACELAHIKYPQSHEMDWDDQRVWQDMMRSPVGIFQMEGEFAFKLLKDFGTKSIQDMSLVTACIRPSGASYRDDLIAKKQKHNPSPIIDELLKDNYGYLVYQQDTIKFLQQICGLSGSEADNVRRAIGRKDRGRLEKALPQILQGYCQKSPRPRKEAQEQAKQFIQIIQDSASYQFGLMVSPYLLKTVNQAERPRW